MKIRLTIVLAAGMAALQSCTVTGSLYPICADTAQAVIKKEIQGEWVLENSTSEHFIMTPGYYTPGRDYLMTAFDTDTSLRSNDSFYYRARLFNLGDSLYMDLRYDLSKNDKDQGDLEVLSVPRHFLFRLTLRGYDTLMVWYVNPEKLIPAIDSGKIKLHYAMLHEDDYLILDKSDVLMKELKKNRSMPGLYRLMHKMIRVK